MRVLVSLVEPHELRSLGIEDLPARAKETFQEFITFPIPDVGVPTSARDTVGVVSSILEQLRLSRTVAIHCRGGLGRTGLIAACCLVALGHDPKAAVSLVRATRPGAIETASQERFVGEFAKRWSRSYPDSTADAARTRNDSGSITSTAVRQDATQAATS